MKAIRLFAVLLLVLLLGACSGGGDDMAAEETAAEGSGASPESAGGEGFATRSGGLSAGDAERGEGSADIADDSAQGAAEGSDSGDDTVIPPVGELPDAPAGRPGDRVIKEGTVSIEVEKGEFDRAFLAVVAAARNYGGDVVGSSTRTADDGDTFGSVTVRVPVENFEDLVVGMGDIGAIRNRDVDSQDVSAEYTDLQSRLRHLQAQETFYLGLFDKADSVRDAISVQQQLEGIQGAIEKIQGRMNFLDDRTSFSTLTVELFEPGAGAPLLAEEEEPATDRPTFAHYWDTARDAFVNVVGAMLVVLVFLAPLLVPAVVIWALWVINRRQRRATPPPRVEEERETVGADR